jgi:hypothetical protein
MARNAGMVAIGSTMTKSELAAKRLYSTSVISRANVGPQVAAVPLLPPRGRSSLSIPAS